MKQFTIISKNLYYEYFKFILIGTLLCVTYNHTIKMIVLHSSKFAINVFFKVRHYIFPIHAPQSNPPPPPIQFGG